MDREFKKREKTIGAYDIIGCAYEKIGDIEIAIEHFTIVIELDPTHVNDLLARGTCLIGQYKEALDDYENALKLDEEKSKSKGIQQESVSWKRKLSMMMMIL